MTIVLRASSAAAAVTRASERAQPRRTAPAATVGQVRAQGALLDQASDWPPLFSGNQLAARFVLRSKRSGFLPRPLITQLRSNAA